jgi:hypothetical protein
MDEQTIEKLNTARWRMPGRETLMTRMDEAIFSLALRDEIPHICFIDDAEPDGTGNCVCETIADCKGFRARAEVVASNDAAGTGNAPAPLGRFVFERSHWSWHVGRAPIADDKRWAFDPPILTSGRIWASWDANDPADAAKPVFQRKVWRILACVTTNRLKMSTPLSAKLQWGSDVMTMADAKRQGRLATWAGHHALAWCAAGGPRRMLDGALRPCDDWAPPQDAWYQRLRRQAEERYGADFGLPPERPEMA